jgi:hypothetical protein
MARPLDQEYRQHQEQPLQEQSIQISLKSHIAYRENRQPQAQAGAALALISLLRLLSLSRSLGRRASLNP